jgi:NAD(P)-dependent dehydrogenase (short-subunit alcohol dehydrogenase family)
MTQTRTILVTGATDGIGRTTAMQLAAAGHDVIVHGRNLARARAAIADIEAKTKRKLPAPAIADLADLDSVAAAAAEINGRSGGLDVVVLNAGVYANAPATTKDGHELTIGVNHLAHFALTLRLLTKLQQAEQGRVVVVSSMAHSRGKVDFAALEQKRVRSDWSGYGAYGESKLMNVLFAHELARRLQRTGSVVTANSLHPGVVSTKLLREGFGMNGPDSLDEGAATSVFLAIDPSVAQTSGGYFQQSRKGTASDRARSVDDATHLWTVSEAFTGVTFPAR